RPRHRSFDRRMGRCRSGDRRGRQGRRASSRHDRRRRRRGLPEDRCRTRELEGDLSMSLSKVWVYAETEGDKVKTITLEMLAKARELGDAVEAVYGGDASAIAETLGKHGATKVYATGDLGGGLPGPHVSGAMAEAIKGGNSPDLIMFGTTYEV